MLLFSLFLFKKENQKSLCCIACNTKSHVTGLAPSHSPSRCKLQGGRSSAGSHQRPNPSGDRVRARKIVCDDRSKATFFMLLVSFDPRISHVESAHENPPSSYEEGNTYSNCFAIRNALKSMSVNSVVASLTEFYCSLQEICFLFEKNNTSSYEDMKNKKHKKRGDF